MSSESKRILLTGSTGQVGGDLLTLLESPGNVIAPSRHELDLANPTAIRKFLREAAPRWIVNPAAYTAVDKAESEPKLAQAINVEAVRTLGEEAARLGACMIHFSTDYVFNGTGITPRKEDDLTGPLGVYGRTKLEGERALAQTGAAHAIFRTSWVYAAHGKNFLRTILRFAREREELRIVADQHGAPTWSRDLASLTLHIIKRTEQLAIELNVPVADALRVHGGVYHAANAGETTWFDFAKFFVRLAAEAEPNRHFAKLVPITTADYPTPAVRPANSRLDCSRLRERFGFSMPQWQDSTRAVMAEVLASGNL